MPSLPAAPHAPARALWRSASQVALVAFLALCLFAPLAQAAPKPPALTATTPQSPNFSTTPSVLGHAGELGTSVVSRAFRPVGSAEIDAAATVTVYTDPACSGPVAAEGTLGQLETTGIPVTVAPGSTTTFHATLTDPAEPGSPSSCSSGLAYRQVSGPPPAPTVSGVEPASPADDNAPRIKGSAEADSTVAIYSDASCSGPALAAGSAAAFATAGIPVAVADNSTTTFYAAASWAAVSSPCSSSSVTFEEVTVAPPPGEDDPPPGEEAPPEQAPAGGISPAAPAGVPGKPAPPRLRTVPGGRANNTAPLVAGSAPGAARVVIYKGEGCDGPAAASAPAADLGDGIPVRVDPNSTTSFSGISVDAEGDRSRCSPEPVVYVEDSSPPLTRITFGPGVKTRKRAPVFRFADVTSDPPGTVFLCKLDRRPWQPCQSPWRLSRVRPRAHVAMIRGIDAAGNAETAPAKRRFKVIARPAR